MNIKTIKRNIILTLFIIVLCALICCVTYLVMDNDILYALWSLATLVIGVVTINKMEDWADYLSGRS